MASIPAGVARRAPEDAVPYNAAAWKVMDDEGVVVNDLHATALPHSTVRQAPGSVHFTDAGAAAVDDSNAIATTMMMQKQFLAGAAGLCLVQAAVSQSLPPSLQHFLGDARFQTQELWSGGTGGRSIIVAHNGDVLVIKGGESSEYKRSTNGGLTWTSGNASAAARFSNAVLDESNGKIFLMNGSSQVISSSADHGMTWTAPQPFQPTPDRFGFRPTSHSSMQAGITLRFGTNAGRLLLPARIQAIGGNEVATRGYNYSTAVYSDDHGVTWHTSDPFPVLGTGEAALVELRDGRVIYNSREHMSRGNRFIATSYNGGKTWLSPYRDPVLPDGPRGTSYGCMGGLIRLPVDEYDILLYSNLDTDKGEMPSEVGGTRTRERERITVWGSFDGGNTWPVKRLVFDGPSAYSNLGVGRAGTASQGKIFLMYDGGPKGRNTGCSMERASHSISTGLPGVDLDRRQHHETNQIHSDRDDRGHLRDAIGRRTCDAGRDDHDRV